MTTQANRRGRGARSPAASASEAGASDSRALQDYAQACRDRDRWSLRRRTTTQRQENFVLALKHLAKGVANDATAQITDRHARVAVRASVYSRLAELMARMEEDRIATQTRALRRGRRRLLVIALALAVAFAATLSVSRLAGLMP